MEGWSYIPEWEDTKRRGLPGRDRDWTHSWHIDMIPKKERGSRWLEWVELEAPIQEPALSMVLNPWPLQSHGPGMGLLQVPDTVNFSVFTKILWKLKHFLQLICVTISSTLGAVLRKSALRNSSSYDMIHFQLQFSQKVNNFGISMLICSLI